MDVPLVAIVNARPETIIDDVRRVMILAGWSEHLAGAEEVVLVPGPDAARWLPAAVREVVAAAAREIRESSAPLPGRGLVLLPSLAADPLAGAARALLGWRPGERPVRRRRVTPEVLGELLSLQRQQCPRTFVVMDATECGGTGANVLIAGADPAAVDAVAARLTGREPAVPTSYELVGDADAREVRVTPRVGRNRRRETPWSRLRQDWEGR
jgi:hypothetical protein